MLRQYYLLTKPGIIYGNALTAIGGFLLAANGHVKLALLLDTLVGMSLVMAAACVFNNYLDRGIDAKMARTEKRALVTGAIPVRWAMLYGIVLAVGGFAVLIKFTNVLTVGLGTVAIFTYVVVYGFSKRHTVHSTVVGSIAGATPPVAGYTAAAGHLDAAALLLFLILVCWQMPHFYAIAIYRFKDYKRAGLPVMPVKEGLAITKIQIVVYILLFAVAVLLLHNGGYTGNTYAVVMGLLSLLWLRKALNGFRTENAASWARSLFLFSLIVITSFSLLLVANAWLP